MDSSIESSSEIDREQAIKSLKKDFADEGFNTLMEGVDAIVDITKKFNMHYAQVSEKIKDFYEKGMVREIDGVIMGIEKKQEE